MAKGPVDVRKSRTARRFVASALALALGLLGVTFSTYANAGTRYRVRTRLVAPGVVWKRIVDTRRPNRINAVIVTPSATASVDVASAGPFPSRKPTSRLGASRDAVVAIDGDFGSFEGRPTDPFVMDGAWIESGFQRGQIFAMSADQTRAFVGRGTLAAGATSRLGTVPVAKWNTTPPRKDQVAAFTSAGGSLIQPPSAGCEALLTPTSIFGWTPGEAGIARTYSVVESRCADTGLLPTGEDVVLATRRGSTQASWFTSLVAGDGVSVQTSLGWAGVEDVIGGWPALLQDGTSVAPATCGGSFCDANPRTGVGITSGCVTGSTTCKVILMTVDGRQPGYSVGMTLPQFARWFKRLGASWAMNLDGGGSTTMWISGLGVVNRPCYGHERSVVNALVVLPGRDPADPLT